MQPYEARTATAACGRNRELFVAQRSRFYKRHSWRAGKMG